MKIDKPCPMYLSQKDKVGDNHFCKSCKCEVIDFTNKSIKEIQATLRPNMCGTFRVDQLSHQPRMTIRRRLVFNILTIISFLGFNVQPVSAVQYSTQLTNSSDVISPVEKDKEGKKAKKRRRKYERYFKHHKNVRGKI